jgi:hypothetical protein
MFAKSRVCGRSAVDNQRDDASADDGDRRDFRCLGRLAPHDLHAGFLRVSFPRQNRGFVEFFQLSLCFFDRADINLKAPAVSIVNNIFNIQL